MCDVHHREYSESEKSGVEITFKVTSEVGEPAIYMALSGISL